MDEQDSGVAENRPDLSAVAPEVLSYIEQLEAEVTRLRTSALSAAGSGRRIARAEVSFEPSEPPTTINILTISQNALIKRTPRHLYARQRRSGMGIFDLDVAEGDQPRFLVSTDESAGVVLITNQGRVFRIETSSLVESPVRDKGESLHDILPLRDGEAITIAMSNEGGSQVIIVTDRGQLRRYAGHHFNQNFQQGMEIFNVQDVGIPVASCWTSGGMELFIATRQGRAIRFAEKLVPVRGCLGMRVEMGDEIISIAAAPEDGAVFMVTESGKGTIRLLSGFSANKAPGSGGKTAMKTDALIGVMGVDAGDDLFIISEQGKIIRFRADDVPAKAGVVQGVNCMALRADSCVAMVTSLVEATLEK